MTNNDSVTPPPPVRPRRTKEDALREHEPQPKKRRRGAQRKAKQTIWKNLNCRLEQKEADVIYYLADKYDVSVIGVLRKMVQDGIRAYAPDKMDEAGVKPEEPNPFQTMKPVVRQPAYAPGTPFLGVPTYVPTHVTQASALFGADAASVMLPAGIGHVPSESEIAE